MATPTTGEERIEIGAPPEGIYDLVSDLPRMGEWSPECHRVEWVGDATGPAVGAEFLGHNHIGPYRWKVGGKVVAADRGRESTRWRYRFDLSGAGTVATEAYEFVWATPLVRLGNMLMPRQRIPRRGMRQTLQRIKAAGEAG